MILRGMRNAVKSYLPREALSLLMPLYRTYVRSYCWYVGLWDHRYAKRTGLACLPPAFLRYLVHGSPDVNSYVEVGKRCCQDIRAALERTGKDLGSFEHVLDFGCGCGRVLYWLSESAATSRFYGTDIDRDAISWCRNNLVFARFRVNSPLPPLEYPSEAFDLVCAVSVFTHLSEDHQFRWLGELKRVTKPRGVVLLTVHGRHCWQSLPPEDVARIEREGHSFVTVRTMDDVFPDLYRTAFHTKEYVLERYARYFEIVDYIPRGLNDHQDMVVLRKA